MLDADPPTASVYSISKLEDLERLPALRLTPGRVGVRLSVPGFDEHRRIEMERRLASTLGACGCDEGGIATTLYILIVPILALLGPLSPHSVPAWIALLGGLFAAGALGKLIGLAIARLRLLRLVNQLEDAYLRHPA
ncbi:MAG TPA: hypothetical protein VFS48_05590 [Solirubrobacterales bacterium]|nr:hypothetical protein [Solirubrobacterales bacterium]